MNVEFDLELDDGAVITFEWDGGKASSNFDKHGIRFEEATEIFVHDPLTFDDDTSEHEVREISFGPIGQSNSVSVIVCVVHTERNGNIRIISARKASSHERKNYDVYFRKTLG